MRVAVIQLAPRITNPDDRFALEDVPVESFRPQPRPPRKPVILRALKPRTAPLILHRLIVRSFSRARQRGGFSARRPPSFAYALTVRRIPGDAAPAAA